MAMDREAHAHDTARLSAMRVAMRSTFVGLLLAPCAVGLHLYSESLLALMAAWIVSINTAACLSVALSLRDRYHGIYQPGRFTVMFAALAAWLVVCAGPWLLVSAVRREMADFSALDPKPVFGLGMVMTIASAALMLWAQQSARQTPEPLLRRVAGHTALMALSLFTAMAGAASILITGLSGLDTLLAPLIGALLLIGSWQQVWRGFHEFLRLIDPAHAATASNLVGVAQAEAQAQAQPDAEDSRPRTPTAPLPDTIPAVRPPAPGDDVFDEDLVAPPPPPPVEDDEFEPIPLVGDEDDTPGSDSPNKPAPPTQ